MPEATLEAVADHGKVRGDTISGTYDAAQQVLDDLAAAGISYDDVVEKLETEGVAKFEEAWNSLIESVTEQLEKAGADVMPAGATKPAGDGPASASPEATAG
jgi:transaldolase